MDSQSPTSAGTVTNLLGLKKFDGMSLTQFDGQMVYNELRDQYGITAVRTTVSERNSMVTVALEEADTKAVLALIDKCSHSFQLSYDRNIYLLCIYL